jgi:hypothetical protein
MHDEHTARQRAICLRLAGRSVKHIGTALGRSETWFHKRWGRYLEAGPGGLDDRGLRLRKLPGGFVAPTERQPLAAGRVTFIRRVSVAGMVTLLSQSFRVGKRLRGLYLRLVVDTGRRTLTAYLNGRVVKRWPTATTSSWSATCACRRRRGTSRCVTWRCR